MKNKDRSDTKLIMVGKLAQFGLSLRENTVRRLFVLFLLCLLVSLLAGGESPKSSPCPCPKPCPKKPSVVKDGSVVFIRGGLLVRPIYRHTDSTLTHVAIILYS